MLSMPSCTTPTFSKMPATSHDTQPAVLVICQASGSAMANTPTSSRWACHSHRPTAAVATSNSAFISHSVQMNRVTIRMWPAIEPWCAVITSRTCWSSSLGRANSFTVRMLL